MIKMLKQAALVLASSLLIQNAVGAEKITYLFPAPDTLPAFAPFQIAKHKGYYADEGLDVSFQIGKGGADVAKQVAVGNADMGGGIGDTPIVTRANGLKVKGVALLGGQALTQIAVRRDAGIESAADLRDRAIGVLSFKDTTYYNLLAVLASAGLSKNDASVQALGPGGIIKLMISGDIQAMSGVPEWVAAVQAAGIEVDVWNINDIFPAMAQAMFASDETIAERPEAVQGFVNATLKAVREIQASPAQAASDYIAAVPSHQGKEAQITDILTRYTELVYPTQAPLQLGQFDEVRLKTVQDFYLHNDIVRTAVPIADTFTNQFVSN
uniref:ABC transporter substrate-binding protein n=1 Tax=Marinobacterium profundum TaxID=1714300 RepID=UPI00082CD778|nr:ABC transporter substrate-binding protein [Marinobacterium profundum]